MDFRVAVWVSLPHFRFLKMGEVRRGSNCTNALTLKLLVGLKRYIVT